MLALPDPEEAPTERRQSSRASSRHRRDSHDEDEETAAEEPAAAEVAPRRRGGCTACGSVANLRDLDPELVRRARAARARRTPGRSLGFLGGDAKPRR